MAEEEKGQAEKLGQLVVPAALLTTFLSFPCLSEGMLWLLFLIPLPVVFYLTTLGARQGLKITGLAVLLSTALVTAAGEVGSLIFSLSLLPVGLALAAGVARSWTPTATGLRAWLGFITVWLLLAGMVGWLHQQNPYLEMTKTLDTLIQASAEAYRQSPEFNKEHQVEIEAVIGQLRLLAPRILPAMLSISMLFLVWMNLLLAHWLLKRRVPSQSPWPEYKDWQLPDHLVWLVIVGGGLQLAPSGALHTVGLNVLLIVGLLYLFQGLAVLNSLLLKWAVPRPVKIFIFLLLMLQFFGIILLGVLGLADVWIKFRRPAQESS